MRDVDYWIDVFIVHEKQRIVNVVASLLFYIELILKASTTRQVVPRQIVVVTLAVIIVIVEMDIVKRRLTLSCRGTRKMMITMLRLVWVLWCKKISFFSFISFIYFVYLSFNFHYFYYSFFFIDHFSIVYVHFVIDFHNFGCCRNRSLQHRSHKCKS